MMLNGGLNKIRDLINTDLTTGGIGLDTTTELITNTGLYGSSITLNACDATTGWSKSGDAGTITSNTTSGEYIEGTACVNLPTTYSAGSSLWYRTVTAFNAGDVKVVGWFYIANQDHLAATTPVKIYLGTGGTTNRYEYTFDKADIVSGWNSLIIDSDTPDSSSGTGLVSSNCDTLGLYVEATATQGSVAQRMDYWRYYVPSTLGVTDSLNTLAKDVTASKMLKTTHTVSFTESNGLDITEAGDNNGTTLYNRYTFTPIYKDDDRELVIDKYYTIQGD